MTMSDEDRIQLMLLVKEGKISVQEAVDTVLRLTYLLTAYVSLAHSTLQRAREHSLGVVLQTSPAAGCVRRQ